MRRLAHSGLLLLVSLGAVRSDHGQDAIWEFISSGSRPDTHRVLGATASFDRTMYVYGGLPTTDPEADVGDAQAWPGERTGLQPLADLVALTPAGSTDTATWTVLFSMDSGSQLDYTSPPGNDEGIVNEGGGEPLPGEGELFPGDGELFPGEGELLPDEGELLPNEGELLPDEEEQPPATGADADGEMGGVNGDDILVQPPDAEAPIYLGPDGGPGGLAGAALVPRVVGGKLISLFLLGGGSVTPDAHTLDTSLKTRIKALSNPSGHVWEYVPLQPGREVGEEEDEDEEEQPTWNRLAPGIGASPLPRMMHSALHVNSCTTSYAGDASSPLDAASDVRNRCDVILIFGGTTSTQALGDTWVLRPPPVNIATPDPDGREDDNAAVSPEWVLTVPREKRGSNVGDGGVTSAQIKTPKPRYGHAAVMFDPDHMVITGGYDTSGFLLDDCWVLDVRTWEWQEQPYSMGVGGRAFHSMISYAGSILIIGGHDGDNNAEGVNTNVVRQGMLAATPLTAYPNYDPVLDEEEPRPGEDVSNVHVGRWIPPLIAFPQGYADSCALDGDTDHIVVYTGDATDDKSAFVIDMHALVSAQPLPAVALPPPGGSGGVQEDPPAELKPSSRAAIELLLFSVYSALACGVLTLAFLFVMRKTAEYMHYRNNPDARNDLRYRKDQGLSAKAIRSMPAEVYHARPSAPTAPIEGSGAVEIMECGNNGADSTADTCAICLVDYCEGDGIRRMPGCGHVFHSPCIDQWLETKGVCPMCKQSILIKEASAMRLLRRAFTEKIRPFRSNVTAAVDDVHSNGHPNGTPGSSFNQGRVLEEQSAERSAGELSMREVSGMSGRELTTDAIAISGPIGGGGQEDTTNHEDLEEVKEGRP